MASAETQGRRPFLARFWGMMAVAALVLLLDRLSKLWVLRHFELGESRRVASFFFLTLVQNTGTAFGLLQGNNTAMLLISSVILGVLLYGARGLSERGGLAASLGIALVIGGAVGNLIDRLQYGQVVDFLDFRIWPVFNVADSAITIGAFSLAFGLWKAGE